MAISKELQALNDAIKNKTISMDDYSKRYREQATIDAQARADALKASQPVIGTAPVKGSDFVQMWTGSGTSSVNPNYVAQKEQQGWTVGVPSQEEMSKMIEMARSGVQGTWSPTGGVAEKQPANQIQPPVQMVGGGASSQAQPTSQPQTAGIDELTRALRDKNVSALQRAYEKSLGGLEAERATIAPQAQQVRSNIRRSAINEAKDFENWLATKGLSAGGTAGQGLISQGLGLQSNLGASQTAEQQAMADIERRRAMLGTDLQSGIAEAEAGANVRNLELQMEARQLAEQQARQDAQLAEQRQYTEGLAGEQQARADFSSQIMANYNDLASFAQRLQSQGTPQWQIDQVLAARTQKTMEQRLDPITGQPIQVAPQTAQLTPSVAMQLWETLGTSTPAIAQALGVQEGQRFPTPTFTGGGSTKPASTLTQDRSYAFDLWEQLGTANESVASILGIPVGTPYSGQGATQGIAYQDIDSALKNVPTSQGADLLVRLEQSGQLSGIDDNQLAILVNKYGITPDQIRQAENRATIPTQGITLPSGNVIR